MDPQLGASADVVGHYKGMLKAAQPGGALEAMELGGEPDLSDGAIRDRLGATKSELHRIVTEYLGDRPDLHHIANQIADSADRALRILRDGDEQSLRAQPGTLDTLEAIVRTDGSRPSFMIRNGEVDRSTSPIGTWANTLEASADLLRDAIGCVGRIDAPGSAQGFEGTGFLIHDDLIITNRHVLQAIGTLEDDGTWKLTPSTAIDFGHEFRARDSIDRRALRRVVYAGAKPIAAPIDHTKLDLALIELEPAAPGKKPRVVLSVDEARDWPQPQLPLFIVGYPGTPVFGANAPSLLELLFQTTFGCKRLAPGLVMKSQANVHTWTAAHDATTLGGNSGSILLVVGREHAAAGLHYGGRSGEPRENWGHVLGLVLDESDRSGQTLRQHLTARGVRLVDRSSAGPH